MADKCLCGNRATVVGPGGFEICRSCNWKIARREWDIPTIAILNNAGYRIYRFHWLHSTDKPTDSYGVGVAEAFRMCGYGGGAIRAIDYYEEITEANIEALKEAAGEIGKKQNS